MRLQDLPFPAVRAALERGAVALFPAGATEAHGPHLPLGTDVTIAEETCRRALAPIASALGLEALILPPLAFTVTEYAAPFAGTISVPASVAVVYMREVMVSASRHGFRAICVVNAHLEPAHRHAMREAVRSAKDLASCPLAIADPCDRRWVPSMSEEFQSGACHAGRYETSLALAAGAPVDRALARSLEPVGVDLVARMRAGDTTFLEMGAELAYFGDPARATKEEGDETYARLVDIVCTVLAETLGKPTREAQR